MDWQGAEWILGDDWLGNIVKTTAVVKKITPRVMIMYERLTVRPYSNYMKIIIEDIDVPPGTYSLFYDEKKAVITNVPMAFDFSHHKFVVESGDDLKKIKSLKNNVVGHIPLVIVRRISSIVEIEVEGETVIQFFPYVDILRHGLIPGEVTLYYNEKSVAIITTED